MRDAPIKPVLGSPPEEVRAWMEWLVDKEEEEIDILAEKICISLIDRLGNPGMGTRAWEQANKDIDNIIYTAYAISIKLVAYKKERNNGEEELPVEEVFKGTLDDLEDILK